VRWVHDSTCHVNVAHAVIPASKGAGEGLREMGFDRSDRHYLVFLEDANGTCGYANVPTDDQPGPSNRANSGNLYGIAQSSCGWNAHTAGHGLMHTFGAVQLSAPHSSGGYHCTDEYDAMCYSDTPNHPPMQFVCTPSSSWENRFDCRHDDYFNTVPAAGS